MSSEDTLTKNEILRKIKYQKMKKTKLANFVRIEREKILNKRNTKGASSQKSSSYDDSI